MLPSFLFAGMDTQTKRLAEELESLGGGDAKVSQLELHAIVDDSVSSVQSSKDRFDVPTKRSQLSQVLWPLGKSVGLRNIKTPGDLSYADSMRYYDVSSAIRVSSLDQRKHSPHYPQSIEIAKWIKNGFNATAVNYGPVSGLKSSSVFGPSVSLDDIRDNKVKMSRPTLVSEILGSMFDQSVRDGTPSESASIAISMWYLQRNDVVDVCARKNGRHNASGTSDHQGEWLKFASIECPDYATAIKVIQTSRSRCPSSEHHLFLRILYFRPDRQTNFKKGYLSHLHIVDLAPVSSVDDMEHRKLPDENSRILRREKWLQLNSLWQVLKEMSELSRKSDPKCHTGPNGAQESTPLALTSARSSKLTAILAPLLQGNTKTWLFVHLLDGEKHFDLASHTLRHVDGVTDIATGCYRVKDVDFESLDVHQAATVLLPVPDNTQNISCNEDETPAIQVAVQNENEIEDDDINDAKSYDSDKFKDGINLHSLANSNMFKGTNFQALPNYDRSSQDFEIESKKQTKILGEKKAEYNELMAEFHALMEEVSSSSSKPAVPSREDPIEENIGQAHNFFHDSYKLSSTGTDKGLQFSHPTFNGISHTENDLQHDSSASSCGNFERDSDYKCNEDDEHLWDSLDEDESRFSGSSQREMGSLSMSSNNSSVKSSKEQSGPAQHVSSARSSPEKDKRMVTNSFYDWAAARPEKTTTLANSPKREIDVTHEELTRSIERQKVAEEMEKNISDSERFPYYDTVQAIESESPHSKSSPTHPAASTQDISGLVYESRSRLEEVADNESFDDTSRLEHVNNSLLLALQQEKHSHKELEKKLNLMEDDAQEARMQLDVAEESHKIEVLRLKGHIRRLSQESGFEETLQAFEEDLSRVTKEKDLLKKQNSQLEEKLFLMGCALPDDPTGNKENKPSAIIDTSFNASKLSVVWTADGIKSASDDDWVSAKEFRVLKHKYKRAVIAKDEISAAFEELKRKERKYTLSTKHFDDTTRRYRALYAEHEDTIAKLNDALSSLEAKSNEVDLLQHEAVALQQAERSIRAERANILHELSVSRQRVRELEAERKNQRYANRFISKHGLGGVRTRSEDDVESTSQQKKLHKSNQEYFDLLGEISTEYQHIVPLPNVEPRSIEAVTGVAGRSDASYIRAEEIQALSVELEQALLDLRDAITLNCPSLLPLIHKLSNELRKERDSSHQQKAALVVKLSDQRRLNEPSRQITSQPSKLKKTLSSRCDVNKLANDSSIIGASVSAQNRYSNIYQSSSSIQSEKNKESKSFHDSIFSTASKGPNKPKMVFFRREEET